MEDSTKRFSDRVENYKRFRPSYPHEAIEYLFREFDIPADAVVADVGSGTGILTELLLPRVSKVYAVEPNHEMSQAAVARLGHRTGFVPQKGTSDHTGIESHTVDGVFAAQAAHWFDLPKTKKEFSRILKGGGSIFLIWNKRQVDSDFLVDYENLVGSIPGYSEVSHHSLSLETLKDFLGPRFQVRSFPNAQSFDFEGLHGRFCSSSYTPPINTPEYDDYRSRLRRLFDQHAVDDRVTFPYRTEVYSGQLP